MKLTEDQHHEALLLGLADAGDPATVAYLEELASEMGEGACADDLFIGRFWRLASELHVSGDELNKIIARVTDQHRRRQMLDADIKACKRDPRPWLGAVEAYEYRHAAKERRAELKAKALAFLKGQIYYSDLKGVTA